MNKIELQKLCPRCGIQKDFSDFNHNRSRPDGLQNWCHSCHNQWKQEHPEIAKKNAKDWYEEHRDRHYKFSLLWKQNNPEKHNAHTRLWQEHIEPQVCIISGCTSLGEKHHDQYDNPFDFVWLCHRHHNQYHKGLLEAIWRESSLNN